LTNRKDNPLSEADAIQQASDDFVNYDIPMHRGMQYLDDMGIFMFSKYYLRIPEGDLADVQGEHVTQCWVRSCWGTIWT